MSRIGKMPISVPAGVEVKNENNLLTVKGPKGQLSRQFSAELGIDVENGTITVTRPNDDKRLRSLHGLTRTLINNMVEGVTNGYSKTLEIEGVGYRAAKSGNKVNLNLGFSHPVELIISFLKSFSFLPYRTNSPKSVSVSSTRQSIILTSNPCIIPTDAIQAIPYGTYD